MGFEGRGRRRTPARGALERVAENVVGDGEPEKSAGKSLARDHPDFTRRIRGRQDRGLRLDEQKPGEAPGVTDVLGLRAAVESLIPRRSAPTKSRDRWRMIGCREGTE